jgi:hypothetical protein
MDAPARPPVHPAVTIGLGLFLAAGGVPITYLGAAEIGPELEVRTAGTRTKAKVVDMRIMERRRTTSYDLKYRFKVKGRTYTVKDATGRENLWTGVPEDEWRKAKKTGVVPILYLKRDPWHNRPVNAGFPLGDKVAGLGLGLTLLLGGLGALFVGVRGLLRGRS